MRRFFFLSGLMMVAGLSASAEEKKAAGQMVAYLQDFEKVAVGEAPDELFVIDGDFTVVEEEKNRFLEMAADPIQENGFLFGKSSKGAARVEASIRGEKKRRSGPRFGVGLHGISGFRLRVVSGNDVIELLKDEEVVLQKPFDWKANIWSHLVLEVLPSATAEGKWEVKGWAWQGKAEDRPDSPTISHQADGAPGQGKASAWGSPYSGKVIHFDGLKAEAWVLSKS